MSKAKLSAALCLSFIFVIGSQLACASAKSVRTEASGQSDLRSTASAETATAHHSLSVSLDPYQRSLSVTDRIRFPAKGGSYRLSLHEGLSPKVVSAGASLVPHGSRKAGDLVVEEYRLTLAPGDAEVELSYAGVIYHPLSEAENEASRGISETPGLISDEGVSLFGETFWYPHLEGVGFVTFELTVTTPPSWVAMSQGVRTQNGTSGARWRSTWEAPERQQSIHLNAAVFHEVSAKSGKLDMMAFLRTPDSALATRYLNATDRYLRMYVDLLGDYPYGKFALVENFWDTGYGMPSFTLIGSNVLRLPFIITTSYPHEILHVWWGNGVYVDDATGNWCEGLTSYMADHLLGEQAGTGTAYRRDTLNQYTSAVTEANDFSLSRFLSRVDPATSAIGYGKALMFFHMLRVQLGDELFIRGFRRFYQDQRFNVAGYSEIRAALEAMKPGLDLGREFQQWVNEKGAPSLEVRDVFAERLPKAYRLHVKIAQAQGYGPLFTLKIPVAIHLKGDGEAHQAFLTMDSAKGREQEWTMDLPSQPYRVEVDPEFDVFRRLSQNEMPPSFSRAYGAARTIVLLPASASASMQDAYRRLAEGVQKNQSGAFEIMKDEQLSSLAELKGDASVWILGAENRFASDVEKSIVEYGVKMGADTVEVQGKTFARAVHAFAFTSAPTSAPQQTWIWVTLESPDAASATPILGSKLPHYGKYSFAVFEIGAGQGGSSPIAVTQRLSGQWATLHSPLSVLVRQPGGGVLDLPRAKLKARVPLVP